jgi:hypothetical protein
MPGFPLAVIAAARCSVRFIADERSAKSINNLSQEHEISGKNVAELEHVVKEEKEITEPHGGTEVVEYMADTERCLLRQTKWRDIHGGCKEEYNQVLMETGPAIKLRKDLTAAWFLLQREKVVQ